MESNNPVADEKWFQANQAKLDKIMGILPQERQQWEGISSDAKELDEQKKAFTIGPSVVPDNSIPPEQTLVVDVAETNNEPRIYSWQELIDANPEDDKGSWLIPDLLRPGWLAVIGGHGKHGKSTLAMHLLNALRLGKPFVNPTQAVPVIYLNCEMHRADVASLAKGITAGTANDGEAAIFVDEISKPLNINWVRSLLTKQKKPGICVIDSFRGAFLLSGDTENQSGTVGSILRLLQDVARRTGWTIIIIHHFRKAATGGNPLDLAGSGEWLSAPDVVLTWHCPNFKEPGTLAITGRVPPWEPQSIRLSREEITFLGTVDEQEAEAQRQKVFETLSGEWVKSYDLAKFTDIPEATIRRRLAELFENNQVERQGEGRRGNPYLWRRK